MLPETNLLQGIARSGWVPIAHLLRPQGRRGELLAEPLSCLPEVFTTGRELILAPANAQAPADNALTIHILEHWFPKGKNAGRIVLKLSGCDSISDAEALAGMQLLIPGEELPILDPDTFFVGDLVGCTLFDGDLPIGSIADLEFPTGPDGRTRLEDAAPLLAVHLTSVVPLNSAASLDPEPVLIPFIRAWLDSVDIPGRRITMRLPKGLVAENEEEQ